jgi:two-component system response regulator AtoC
MPLFRNVLIADDEASIRHVLALVLKDHGYEVRAVSDGEEALRELSARSYDVVISDVRMPKLDGMSLLKSALEKSPELTFLVMSAYGSQEQALAAVQAGAYDYVQKPFKPEEVVLVLRKAEERARLLLENRRLKERRGVSGPLQGIWGNSEVMNVLTRQIRKVAPVSTTVLIVGESGTGKELVARAIHGLSPRAPMPFVTINCGAIPEGLMESELFGHVRGAFTDAKTAKRGLFQEAEGGTLFLDEVGELPPSMQVKLLRVLQEGEVRPIGDTKSEKVDVRVVAATLRDLAKQVEKGMFREDLYFRLNVVQLKVPPLRDRTADILALAKAFLSQFNRELNRDPFLTGFSAEAEALLTQHTWPGNVRELENAIERAVLLAEGNLITPEALPERLWTREEARPAHRRSKGAGETPTTPGSDLSLKRAMRELEETYIRAALKKTNANRTRAAELLEISHRALLYKIKDYGIDPDAEN